MPGTSLFDLLEQYPIFDSVSCEFALRDFFAMSYVSKRIRDVVTPWLCRAQEVDSALKRFFDEPVAFREHLRDMPGVIVGDFAFRYFVERSCRQNRIDIVMLDERLGPESVAGNYFKSEDFCGFFIVRNT
jgi:hypothetical protein